MQCFIPLIVASALVAGGVAAYVYHGESGSRAGVTNNPVLASPSPTARAIPDAQMKTSPSTTAPVPSVQSTPTPTPSPQLQIGRVQFFLLSVNPQFTKQQLSFSLSVPAAVQVQIAPRSKSTPVRTLDLGQQSPGVVRLQWDGRDNAESSASRRIQFHYHGDG